MKQYLDIVRNILENGTEKLPERKLEDGRKLDNGTIGLPNLVFSHNMADGFPLITTKKMGLRNIAVELEFFIKGLTDKRWLKDRGCNIWNAWSNPFKVNQKLIDWQNQNAHKFSTFKECVEESLKLKRQFQEEETDLGPLGYSWGWRKFGQQYGSIKTTEMNPKYPNQWIRHSNGVNHGTDQLQNILDTLKNHPNDRRMVCSAWNPNQLNLMALPPCHLLWIITVYDNKLHFNWTQRSVDVALGLPYNIASYALLFLLLCKHSGLEPGNLTGNLVDCHIYNNQIDGMKEQLTRKPLELPTVEILPKDNFEFFKWTHKDFKLIDYKSYDSIKMEVTI